MKKLSDEQLQSLVENGGFSNKLKSDKSLNSNENLNFKEGLSQDDQQELSSYQFLFENLHAEPKEGLPLSFAADIRRKLQEKAFTKSDLKFDFAVLFLFIAIAASAFGLLYSINPEASEKLGSVVFRFKWGIGLAIICFFSIQAWSQRLFSRE